MKRFIAALISVILLISALPIAAQAEEITEQKEYVVAAYVTPWNWSGLPDPTKVNIINYCFASVDTTTHEVVFSNSRDINYLNALLTLREKTPHLKVLISIGGAGADGFSQAAETEEGREIFAQSCLDLINKYNLDGLDIDWENPVNGGWGTITAIPEDKQNCTLLMKAIREKIGSEKLLTFADGVTDQYASWVEYAELNKYIDYFNMMSYCFAAGAGRKHDSNLFPSSLAAWGGINGVSANGGVQMHLKNGIPAEKIIMGVPFYGVNFDANNSNPKYGQMVTMYQSDGYSLEWDNTAKANYIFNTTTGAVAASLETPASIFYKTNYIKKNGLGGMMYWEYGQDDTEGTLRAAVWEGLNGINKSIFKVNATQVYNSMLGLADCGTPVYIRNGRALIPMRISAPLIGASDCVWNEADQSVTIVFNDHSVVYTINSNEIQLKNANGEIIDRSLTADGEIPQIINGSAYLPSCSLATIAFCSIAYKENENGDGFVVFSPVELTESELDSAVLAADSKITY